jgi:hypothetical protein
MTQVVPATALRKGDKVKCGSRSYYEVGAAVTENNKTTIYPTPGQRDNAGNQLRPFTVFHKVRFTRKLTKADTKPNE